MFMVMMMSSSSSIAATKSMTVRLSHSRSPANVVASVRAMSFLLNGSICAATLSKMSCRLSMLQIPYEIGRANVGTPVTNAHLVCRLMLKNKINMTNKTHTHTARKDRMPQHKHQTSYYISTIQQ